MINIRFATKNDKPKIISFLKEHWSQNSILVQSDMIFDFQYSNGESCYFVIAIDDEDDHIYGLKGYFPFNSRPNPDVAAALAIVLQGVRPMLGMEIEQFLEKETHSRWVCSTGLNPNTSVRVYKLFKNNYTVDKLSHFYRLSDRKNFNIAVVNNKRIQPVSETGYEFLLLNGIEHMQSVFDIEAFANQRPYKDLAYIDYRYFRHPVYKYKLLGIKAPQTNDVRAVIIGREIKINDSKVFRIVDFLGEQNEICHIGQALERMIQQEDYEYVDFYCYGIDHNSLKSGGFVLRDENDQNIIPNYFEPFEQKNVEIHFFYTGHEKATVCKADGDQDRPNMIPEDLGK